MTPDGCKPSVKLVDYLINAPRLIASSAKLTVSNKEFKEILNSVGDNKIAEWIRELVRRGHGSPLEHSLYSFEIVCSRVASHQLVRHRVASYTQLSQRYSDKYLNDALDEILSVFGHGFDEKSHRSKIDALDEVLAKSSDLDKLTKAICRSFIIPPMFLKNPVGFIKNILMSMKTYYEAIENGVNWEDARYAIPQCVKTRLLVSMNARELLEVFLPLRMCIRAHWEIRYIAWRMREELVKIHGEIFSYAGPRCVLMNNRVADKLGTLDEYVDGEVEIAIPRCPELVPREKIRECIVRSSRDPWMH